MAEITPNIKNFFKIQFQIICLCVIYVKSITQDLQVKKLPYLTINSNKTNQKLRKLNIPSNVYGSAFGLNYYYTNLYLGEGMKRQTYIIDTGSTITTAPCQPFCKNCGNHLNSYHIIEDNSKIIQCNDDKCGLVKSFCGNGNKCSFRTSYSEGSSLEGIFINELIRFGEDYNLKIGSYAPIGCTISETHLFLTQKADGIMGLANNDYNFIHTLNKVGAIDDSIFGLCFAQRGGYFSIGEINTTYHRQKITYLNMEKNSLFFSVSMNNIFVNGIKLKKYQKSKYSLIIDSGTTISYFPDEIFNELVTNVKSICNSYQNKNGCGNYEYDKDFGPCFVFDSAEKMDEAIYQYWPNISFILENYEYKWTPDEYIFNDTNRKRVRGCMGFNSGGRRFTFGSTWMIGHEIIFDRKNNRIGIVEANCDKNNNRTVNYNYIGIEEGYSEDKLKGNNYEYEYASLIDYILNENMLNFYIVISIILFLIIVYLIIVLINFKKRRPNAWLWFLEGNNPNEDNNNNNLLPIRYDINSPSNKNENNKEFSMVFLTDSDDKINNRGIKNSKYNKINI